MAKEAEGQQRGASEVHSLVCCLLLTCSGWFCGAVPVPWGSILALSHLGTAAVTAKLP